MASTEDEKAPQIEGAQTIPAAKDAPDLISVEEARTIAATGAIELVNAHIREAAGTGETSVVILQTIPGDIEPLRIQLAEAGYTTKYQRGINSSAGFTLEPEKLEITWKTNVN